MEGLPYLVVSLLFWTTTRSVHGLSCSLDCQKRLEIASRNTLKSLDIEKFSGEWYLAWEHDNFNQFYHKCGKLTIDDDCRSFSLSYQKNDTTNEIEWMNSTIELTQTSEEPKEYSGLLTMPHAPVPFRVVSTDYDNFGIIYSCGAVYPPRGQPFEIESLWSMRRERAPKSAVRKQLNQKVRDIIKEMGLGEIWQRNSRIVPQGRKICIN